MSENKLTALLKEVFQKRNEEATLELRQSVDGLRNARKAEEVTRQWSTMALKDPTGSLHMVDVKNLPEAREMIAKLQSELTAKLVEGDPSELYRLDFQLYPAKKNEAV